MIVLFLFRPSLVRLDVKIIIQNMVGKFKADDVKTAIAQLSEEGHIYSTVDDDHYMVT